LKSKFTPRGVYGGSEERLRSFFKETIFKKQNKFFLFCFYLSDFFVLNYPILQEFHVHAGLTLGSLSSFSLIARKYKLHHMHIQNAVSRYNRIKQVMHNKQTIGNKLWSEIRNNESVKTVNTKTNHNAQANFFCIAPIKIGSCFDTIHSPKIIVGANLGFMKIHIKKFISNIHVMCGSTSKFLKINQFIKATSQNKNIIHALALNALSFNTLYHFTSSYFQKLIIELFLLIFLILFFNICSL